MSEVTDGSKSVYATVARPASSLAWTLVFANLLLVSAVAWGYLAFGSVRNALGYAGGQRLFVDEPSKSFGVVIPGEYRDVSFTLENRGDRPVRILGCGSGCAVHTVDMDLPFVLEPLSRRAFRLRVRGPRRPNAYSFPIHLLTNDPDQPELVLTLAGEVQTLDDGPSLPKP